MTTPELQMFRDDFCGQVPWGSALLRGLEAEGATVTHIRCLRERDWEWTWLLRTKLSKALQERFGLAPEVLLLAVRGEVQVRDLNAARNEVFRSGLRLDTDLILVVDEKRNLADRLRRMGGWKGARIALPLPTVRGVKLRISEALERELPEFDVFEHREPVRGDQVVGRDDLVSSLESRVTAGEWVGVYGMRKVGKTTLVRAVTDRLDEVSAVLSTPAGVNVAASSGPEFARKETLVHVVWVDGETVVPRTADKLSRCFERELRRRASLIPKVVLPRPTDSPLEDLAACIEAVLQGTDKPICIVLDEFENVFEPTPGARPVSGLRNLFGYFRGMRQQTGRLSLVVLGRDPRTITQTQLDGAPNPLLTLLIPIWVGPLGIPESGDLFRRLSRRVGMNTGADEIQTARDWSGRHPLLLRLFGSVLLAVRRDAGHLTRPATGEEISHCVDRFRQWTDVGELCQEIIDLMSAYYPHTMERLAVYAREETIVRPQDDEFAIEDFERLLSLGLIIQDTRGAFVVGRLLRNYIRTLWDT